MAVDEHQSAVTEGSPANVWATECLGNSNPGGGTFFYWEKGEFFSAFSFLSFFSVAFYIFSHNTASSDGKKN